MRSSPRPNWSVGRTGALREMALRREIFGNGAVHDRVILPYFDVPHVFEESGWGLEPPFVGRGPGGAYTWDPPLTDYVDVARLTAPVISIDWDATSRLTLWRRSCLATCSPLAGPVGAATAGLVDRFTSPVRSLVWSFGMTEPLVKLRGLGQMMYDMIDRPQGVHLLMAFLRDAYVAKLDFLEENGLLSLNNDGTYVGLWRIRVDSSAPGSDFAATVRASDMWGFAESQETVGISPRMFDEFVFPYQLSLPRGLG